eukprot:5252015-Lingulodinium_polyedra.AAC.1
MEPASVIGSSLGPSCPPALSVCCTARRGLGPVTSGVSASSSRWPASLAFLMATINAFAWLPEIKCVGVA